MDTSATLCTRRTFFVTSAGLLMALSGCDTQEETKNLGQTLILAGGSASAVGSWTALIPEVNIAGAVLAAIGSTVSLAGSYIQGQVLQEQDKATALPLFNSNPVSYVNADLPVSQAAGVAPGQGGYGTPVLKLKGRRQHTFYVQFDTDNYRNWAYVRGKDNIFYRVTLQWLDWLLNNDTCGFTVTGNTRNLKCPRCNVQLTTQDLAYPTDGSLVSLSFDNEEYSPALQEHRKHMTAFVGCPEITTPEESCPITPSVVTTP